MTALPDRQFFKIGEAAEIVGVKAHVLRYWESEFPSIKPLKTRGAHRMYRRADVELLCVIHKLLHHEGYTIAGARKRVRELRAELRRGDGIQPVFAPSTQAAGELAPLLDEAGATAPDAPEHACEAGAFLDTGEPSALREVSSELGQLRDASRELRQPRDASRELGSLRETSRELGQPRDASRERGSLQEGPRELDQPRDASRELGLLQDASRELGRSREPSRELVLLREASRELGLRAELIQVRRELADLLRELDQLGTPKSTAAQASATVTAVVAKTVLISQRNQSR